MWNIIYIMDFHFMIFGFLTLFANTKGIYDNEINLRCRGETHTNVTLTAYFPDYSDQDHERGYLDVKGKKLRTLQDYIDDRAEFVTISMDESLKLPYGTPVCIPEINTHFGHRIRFEVRDASSNLDGMGFRRADICVRSDMDSYDLYLNRQVTLVILKE